MTRRRLLRATILAAFFLLTAATAFAQSPSPAADAGPQPGICAPWHRCLAFGLLGMVALACLFWLAAYAIQRKGFDRIVHRQGQPGGVKVEE